MRSTSTADRSHARTPHAHTAYVSRRHWQREREDRPPARRVFEPEGAAEVGDDLAAERQAEAGALGFVGEGVAALAEFLEDVLALLWGDAGAVVAHFDAHGVVMGAGADDDQAGLAVAELGGVGEEVEQETDYLKVFISRLRAKLERPGEPRYIETERGLGYRFVRPSE